MIKKKFICKTGSTILLKSPLSGALAVFSFSETTPKVSNTRLLVKSMALACGN
ncbi:hypothetical protein KKE48_05015 [Patescibacteria group bacterium]|nr:hypothetical protein [Patescibacteria group bacterium]MBU1500199.1 hypothetical protein [Patescibacteria group bacterium]